MVEIFFKLHVVGSFDPSKDPILKNYYMFYSKIENNVLQSSNNHPYWKPAILLNKLCLSTQFSDADLEGLFKPNEFDKKNIVRSINHLQFKYSLTHQVD